MTVIEAFGLRLYLAAMLGMTTCTMVSREVHLVLVKKDVNSYNPVNDHAMRQRRQVEHQRIPKPTITKLHAITNIQSRFATTVVTIELENKMKSTNVETSVYVQFPENAFISNFTMVIGGKYFIAKVQGKEEAHNTFTRAQNSNETAGIVSFHNSAEAEPGMDKFSIRTTISAHAKGHFELTYQELLKLKFYYLHYVHVDPHQDVTDFILKVELNEPQGIRYLHATGTDGTEITAIRDGSSKVRIDYSPNSVLKGLRHKGRMQVKYAVNYSCDAGVFKTCKSFFVHYFSTPKSDCSLDVLNRQIYFVIDKSGSMNGYKMEKTRSAMEIILKLLTPGDLFDIVLFDSTVTSWRSMLSSASPDNVDDALRFCRENLMAFGSTNLYDALERAVLRMTPSVSTSSALAPYVILLTDGQPTVGKLVNSLAIQKAIKRLNTQQIPIYSIAFGSGASFEFLNALSNGNNGYAIKIFDGSYNKQDMSQQLQFFYSRIASPVLKNIDIVYPKDVISSTEVTNSDIPQYFDGSEIVIVGKILANAPQVFDIKVTGFCTTGVKEFTKSVTRLLDGDCGLVERIFAYKWMKTLLARASVEWRESKRREIESEALSMSLQYNFVTPLTSMVVVQGIKSTQSHDAERSGVAMAMPRNFDPQTDDNFGRTNVSNTTVTVPDVSNTSEADIRDSVSTSKADIRDSVSTSHWTGGASNVYAGFHMAAFIIIASMLLQNWV